MESNQYQIGLENEANNDFEYPDPDVAQRQMYGWADAEISDDRVAQLSEEVRRIHPDLDEDGDYRSIGLGERTRAFVGNNDDSDEDPEYTAQESESEDYLTPSDPGDGFDLNDPAPTRGRGKRGRGRGRNPTSNRRTRKLSDIESDDLSPRKRLRFDSTTKFKKSKGRRGIRKAIKPTAEFQELHSEALTCYVNKDYDRAEELANQAILVNPEQFSVHSLLSEIHFAKGDLERSVASLFHGAHVRQRDAEVWKRSAELILQRSGDLRIPKLLNDAIYCYSRVLGLDTRRDEERRIRAELYRELGNAKRAIRDYQMLLKQFPTDISIIKALAEMFVEIDDIPNALKHYEEIIDVLQKMEPDQPTLFTWSDLNVYGELVISSEEPDIGLTKLKNVSRWILGRRTDKFWESYTADDREFDIDDDQRRFEVKHLTEDWHDIDSYGAGLPLEIRIQFGVLRLQMEEAHYSEALHHFDFLQPDTDAEVMVRTCPDLYREVAEALRDKKLFTEALRFYEPLKNIEDELDSSFFAHLASCYRHIGKLDLAEACYRTLISYNDSDLKSRRELIAMFHAADQEERATPYLKELADKRRKKYRPMRTVDGRDDRLAFTEPGTIDMDDVIQSIELEDEMNKLGKRRKRWRRRQNEDDDQEDLRPNFLRLKELRTLLEAGDETAKQTWMSTARTLLRRFRETRVFFPYDRYVKFFGYSTEAKAKAIRSKAKQQEIDQELANMLNVSVGKYFMKTLQQSIDYRQMNFHQSLFPQNSAKFPLKIG
jgi:general transcription factor 3C polypeptide 3 (transcription factor C subunit 4)